MHLLTSEQRLRLIGNGRIIGADALLDRPPVVKFFTPDAGGTWLISAMDPHDHDRAWGLCDFAQGSPELGWVSLSELARVRGPLDLPVRRDDAFIPNASLRAYADEARRAGIIIV